MLDEFWWRRKPGVWAKHLAKRNYELWLAFGKNRRGEYLVLTEQSDRQAKRIFFPGGDQEKGWWKLVVAVFELANRPVNILRSGTKSVRIFSSAPISKASLPKQPWEVFIRCPHCEVSIRLCKLRRKGRSR